MGTAVDSLKWGYYIHKNSMESIISGIPLYIRTWFGYLDWLGIGRQINKLPLALPPCSSTYGSLTTFTITPMHTTY